MSFYRRKWNNSAFVGLDLNPIEHLRDELECRIWARVQTCQEYGTPDKSRNKGSWLSQSFGHSIVCKLGNGNRWESGAGKRIIRVNLTKNG
ncbi:hypothetical protein RIR_jg16192.t1 [Rhizophagus irregularis DAOM 181602=DAOM 197198]|nr:hypothetical protein RIR_jg16192.t1 [Rhizophagus irregularis DAOM 181602=DAOM 197198]